MSRLRFQGQVLSASLQPVAGASVKIIDKDEDGQDDVILTRITNDQGNFSGTSTEWQDTRRSPIPGATLPPWTDTMILWFEVRKNGKKHDGPFMYVPGTALSAPIVVPWLEVSSTLARVNGVACDSPQDIISEVSRAANRGIPIDIEILDPTTVSAMQILTESEQEIHDWLESTNQVLGQLLQQITGRRSSGPSSTIQALAVEPVSSTVLIIIACCVLALAIGASAVLVSVAVSLTLATSKGYCTIGADQATELDAQGNTRNTVKLGLRKDC